MTVFGEQIAFAPAAEPARYLSGYNRLLVPMAIALSFGTIASAFVVLLLIPALHEIWSDICRLFGIRVPPSLRKADQTE